MCGDRPFQVIEFASEPLQLIVQVVRLLRYFIGWWWYIF